MLRHYILVSQTAWVLEWFRRDKADQWNYEVLSDPANVLKIPDLNLRLPLSDVYDDPDVASLLPAPESEKPQENGGLLLPLLHFGGHFALVGLQLLELGGAEDYAQLVLRSGVDTLELC